jgi:hypothetical protein
MQRKMPIVVTGLIAVNRGRNALRDFAKGIFEALCRSEIRVETRGSSQPMENRASWSGLGEGGKSKTSW